MHCKVQNILQASIAPHSLKRVLHYYGNHTYFLGGCNAIFEDANQKKIKISKNSYIWKLSYFILKCFLWQYAWHYLYSVNSVVLDEIKIPLK